MAEQTSEQTRVFRQPDRAEKGSALTMIAEAARLRLEKTERLRLLRLEREAEAPAPELPKAKPVRKRKKVA